MIENIKKALDAIKTPGVEVNNRYLVSSNGASQESVVISLDGQRYICKIVAGYFQDVKTRKKILCCDDSQLTGVSI